MVDHPAVAGLPNFRDIGRLRASSGPAGTHRTIRPGLVFRSAAPTRLKPAGAKTLQDLGIATAYDLRSTVEIQRHQGTDAETEAAALPPLTRRVAVPVFQDADYSPEAIALRYQSYASADATAGFVEAYRAILHDGGPAFAAILSALADPTPTPMLIHCTAGKDRTGVICAILLSLCGVDDAAVAAEYALTEAGLAEWRPEMMARLLENPALAGDPEGAVRMMSSRPESMLATLDMLRKEYGSVEEYVLNHCQISPESVSRIRWNLVVDAPAGGEQQQPLSRSAL